MPRFVGELFAGYVGIAIDITDLKRNQEQLLATQKLESLGVLVAGVAHRFNNLMGTIIAEADLASSDLPRDSSAYDSVSRINTTAMKVSEIVALLSAYAGGSVGGRIAPISLSQVVAETHRLHTATSLTKVPVTVAISSDLPPIRADMSQIRQIVMNLLTNACEAIQGHNGSVSVITSGSLSESPTSRWMPVRSHRASMSGLKSATRVAGIRIPPAPGFSILFTPHEASAEGWVWQLSRESSGAWVARSACEAQSGPGRPSRSCSRRYNPSRRTWNDQRVDPKGACLKRGIPHPEDQTAAPHGGL